MVAAHQLPEQSELSQREAFINEMGHPVYESELPSLPRPFRYDGELHLVHYNEIYDNISHAVSDNQTNALAVVGIFLKEVTPWMQETAVQDSATVNSLRKGALELARGAIQ